MSDQENGHLRNDREMSARKASKILREVVNGEDLGPEQVEEALKVIANRLVADSKPISNLKRKPKELGNNRTLILSMIYEGGNNRFDPLSLSLSLMQNGKTIDRGHLSFDKDPMSTFLDGFFSNGERVGQVQGLRWAAANLLSFRKKGSYVPLSGPTRRG